MRRFLSAAAVLLTIAAAPVAGATAQPAWKPEKTVELIVGTNAGTGFDRTARAMQKVWQDQKIVDAALAVINKPGGNGAIGYAYLNQHPRDGHYLAIISPLLLTNNLTGSSPLSWQDVTPLAILMDEEIVFAVKSDSGLASGGDFIARIRKDPASVSIALSGAGGQNHIAVGLVGKAAGLDITKLKIVGFNGSSEAVTSVLGGHVDLVVSPASSVAPHLQAGTLRVIGVPAEHRMGGVFADVPTWREQGIDAVFSNWRGVIGPKNMTPPEIAYWDDAFARLAAAPEWQDELKNNLLGSHYLASAEAKTFLAAENEKLKRVLTDLGLAR